RFQRTVKEYENWASKLRKQFDNTTVAYTKDHHLIEHDITSVDELEHYFTEQIPDEELHQVEVVGHENDGLRVRVIEKTTNTTQTTVVPLTLFSSPGYQSLRSTHARLVELTGPPPFTVRMGKLSQEVHTFESLRP